MAAAGGRGLNSRGDGEAMEWCRRTAPTGNGDAGKGVMATPPRPAVMQANGGKRVGTWADFVGVTAATVARAVSVAPGRVRAVAAVIGGSAVAVSTISTRAVRQATVCLAGGAGAPWRGTAGTAASFLGRGWRVPAAVETSGPPGPSMAGRSDGEAADSTACPVGVAGGGAGGWRRVPDGDPGADADGSGGTGGDGDGKVAGSAVGRQRWKPALVDRKNAGAGGRAW